MQDFDPNIKQINGPVNVVRMEGRIHGIKKVIYVFMDYHEPVTQQTECTNLFSKDVHKYFIDTFYELNKTFNTYDFFMETRPTEMFDEIPPNMPNYKYNYINQIVKLFQKIFSFDKEKNKVNIPDLFKNIRLHYLDVRDYFKHHMMFKLLYINDITASFMVQYQIRVSSLSQIVDILKYIKEHLQNVINILSTNVYTEPATKPVVLKHKDLEALDEEVIKRLSYKMRQRYNDKDIKNKLNKILDEIIDKFVGIIKDIDVAINDFTYYGSTIINADSKLIKDDNHPYIYVYGLSSYTVREFIKDIIDKTQRIYDIFVRTFANLTDVYFLRRFLDKDYITNAIVYAGATHSGLYINILVNHFDFEITHVSYSKISDIKELMEEIKKQNMDSLYQFFSPPILKQCSDMTDFPENFL